MSTLMMITLQSLIMCLQECLYTTTLSLSVAFADTDYSIIFIEASSPVISTEIPDFELSQYYIRSLEHPHTCASLRGHFEAVDFF
ncbi:hypothetical protein DSO57_1020893 [Entomophthora muscae]|uniref:Uncharacterized protein n=1 Tax=Entomophthora muscae TaxID=34485 RepID=A0ACC2TS01_9FUNG|nr:hypothetical protein DSO57_1020893 [Entomophthora muscae]